MILFTCVVLVYKSGEENQIRQGYFVWYLSWILFCTNEYAQKLIDRVKNCNNQGRILRYSPQNLRDLLAYFNVVLGLPFLTNFRWPKKQNGRDEFSSYKCVRYWCIAKINILYFTFIKKIVFCGLIASFICFVAVLPDISHSC